MLIHVFHYLCEIKLKKEEKKKKRVRRAKRDRRNKKYDVIKIHI